MAAVDVTISGVLYDKLNRTMQQVVLIGEASLTGVGVGGGPIIPPPSGGPQPPLGIWGPTDPRPNARPAATRHNPCTSGDGSQAPARQWRMGLRATLGLGLLPWAEQAWTKVIESDVPAPKLADQPPKVNLGERNPQ